MRFSGSVIVNTNSKKRYLRKTHKIWRKSSTSKNIWSNSESHASNTTALWTLRTRCNPNLRPSQNFHRTTNISILRTGSALMALNTFWRQINTIYEKQERRNTRKFIKFKKRNCNTMLNNKTVTKISCILIVALAFT